MCYRAFLAKFDHLSSRLFCYRNPNCLVNTLLNFGNLRKNLLVRTLQDYSSFLGLKIAKLFGFRCFNVCLVSVNHP